MIRTYSELRRLHTFEDRFDYLMLGGNVGDVTLGFDRYLSQSFYTSYEWRYVRQQVILRDRGLDLGVDGYDIHSQILIHHINPMTARDIDDREEWILDPEFLITTTKDTHNAIHFGDRTKLRVPFVERSRGDTRLW